MGVAGAHLGELTEKAFLDAMEPTQENAQKKSYETLQTRAPGFEQTGASFFSA